MANTKKPSNLYYESKDIYLSEFGDRGIYELLNDKMSPDISYKSDERCVKFISSVTKDVYYARTGNIDFVEHYHEIMLNKKECSAIYWPEDIIKIENRDTDAISAPLELEYVSHVKINSYNKKERYNFLYRPYMIPENHSLKESFDSIGEMNYRNPKIRELMYNFIAAIDELYKAGFIFLDYDFRRIRVRNDGSIFFDFTNLLYYHQFYPHHCHPVDYELKGYFTPYNLKETKYPIEFAEPAFVKDSYRNIDVRTVQYSIVAFLFYILFGRYAYDGKTLVGESDENDIFHESKFSLYHNVAEFIFEPDSSNSIGFYEKNDPVNDLWDKADEKVKEFFITILKHDYATRKVASDKCFIIEWDIFIGSLKQVIQSLEEGVNS